MRESKIDELGRIISFHRKRSRLNRQALADLAGVGKTTIFDIEHGKTTVRMNTLVKVLDVLNIALRFQSPLMCEWDRTRLEDDVVHGDEAQ